ncbi:MAG TPA: hypothetical protein VFV72_07430 [Candidatus Limnocylindrales bacterium]|nr:hypothetical protein [Candidatus Limnocylindrales bacterium]
MTRARATGRGSGRGAETLASFRSAWARRAAAAMLALVTILLAVACGPATPSRPVSSPPPASGPVGGARATPWPGNAVLGMEALGLADGQIGAAMTDLSKGVNDENLSLMREAADGLSGVDDALLPNMEKIRLEPGMRSFADRYEAAIKKIAEAATRLRDAIDAGDAPKIASATQDVLAGMTDYTALKPELAAWLEQMPEQKRMYTQ